MNRPRALYLWRFFVEHAVMGAISYIYYKPLLYPCGYAILVGVGGHESDILWETAN